ncbi:MAG: DUF4147 domain-containing protein [Candidatus Liptonbacteria bacterium]
MLIKNSAELGSTELRRQALRILGVGLAAASPETVIRRNVSWEGGALKVAGESLPIEEGGRLFVFAFGKCALSSALVLEDILSERISGGAALDIRPGGLKYLKYHLGDHPFPTERNIAATHEILEALRGLTEKDLVLFIISGGGSTLLCQPQGIGVEEEVALVESLFRSGAVITELNTVRKHLSSARGGYLAKEAYPAHVVSLIFSDVPGDDIGFVSSGPTVKDETTVSDAHAILAKYGISLPESGIMETPKEEKYFEKIKNILIASNRISLEAMSRAAEEVNLKPNIVTAALQGEARDVGRAIAEELHSVAPGTVNLYAGETTVTIKNDGRGGRNQELVLGAVEEVRKGELIASVASDGRDNGDHAGALCDIITREKSVVLNLNTSDYLTRNDSYNFFRATKDYLDTGPTGANLSDLMIAIKS